MPECRPSARSVRNSAASGTSTARRRSEICAPANSARAVTAVKFGGCGNRRVIAAKTIMPIRVVILSSTAFFLSKVRNEVAKNEPVPVDDFSAPEVYRSGEVRSMPDESVKFAILAARVDPVRQVVQKRTIERPSREGRVEAPRVDADQHGAKSEVDEAL